MFTKYGLTAALVLFVAGVVWAGTRPGQPSGKETSQADACKLVGDCCAKGGCCPDGGCCCKDGVCSCVVCECACSGNACCADHGAAKTTSDVKVIKGAKSTPACCKI